MARRGLRQRAALQESLDADLERIATARLRDLRVIWSDRLGEAPPKLRSPEIFRRMLAYRLQAAVFGDLSVAAKRKLTAIETRRANPSKKRAGAPVRLGAGAVLLREWKGVRHEVRVTGGGFEHQGTRYKSLSQVARAITGSRWNGPLFFGLRDKPKAVA